MTYQTPNYFEQGSSKLVLNGPVEYGDDYTPSGASAPGSVTPAGNVSGLSGALGGNADGVMGGVADIALSTSDTYSDAAVNAAVNAAISGADGVNHHLDDLKQKVNAMLAVFKAAGLMVAD